MALVSEAPAEWSYFGSSLEENTQSLLDVLEGFSELSMDEIGWDEVLIAALSRLYSILWCISKTASWQ